MGDARPKLPEGPMFCAGPFFLMEGSGWICGTDAFGGLCHVADIRGWGYLTGRGQALALHPDDAIEAQQRAAKFIVDAMNEKMIRDAAMQAQPTPPISPEEAQFNAVRYHERFGPLDEKGNPLDPRRRG